MTITPLRRQLFSRFRGLLETDVLVHKWVFIVGLGSVGSWVADGLARCGVNFLLMDDDRLEIANVNRQVPGLRQVGRLKTKVMADLIHERNPFAEMRTFETRVDFDTKEQVRQCVRDADLVICATGDRTSGIILNRLCLEENKVLIIGGAFRRAYGGQVLRVRPGNGPCYVCFLKGIPAGAEEPDIADAQPAEGLAYTDIPVPIEPGLGNDIWPVSQMIVKLTIQELLAGTPTTFASLDEDSKAPWFMFLNRREKGTCYEHLKPLGTDAGGMSILRWYPCDLQRDPTCPACGDLMKETARKYCVEISAEDANEFASRTT